MQKLHVVGGGLAGSEAAWQAAIRGIKVELYEMRPNKQTGAHISGDLAELVCSNSFGSMLVDRAGGLLKEELTRLGSMLLSCAYETSVPAGGALAVDRLAFAKLVTEEISSHPNITIIRDEIEGIITQPTIIATGPLTSKKLSNAIQQLTGSENLFFYDAISPIINADSIDFNIAYRASRYGRGDRVVGDYLNCPLRKEEYLKFVHELVHAERIKLHEFEDELEKGVRAGYHKYFEGCLPIEILAQRGIDALAYGPMRPVGLVDPRTGTRPYAVVQLRQDNLAATLYNLVGFQTNLKFNEQKRIFQMIPGLGQASFERFGHMHRNTFLNSPSLLKPSLQFHIRDDLFFAGQITGVEGYLGNIATGLLAGINAVNYIMSRPVITFPKETMLGALCYYITHADEENFQPMKANFGILPPLSDSGIKGKRQRAKAFSTRALRIQKEYLDSINFA